MAEMCVRGESWRANTYSWLPGFVPLLKAMPARAITPATRSITPINDMIQISTTNSTVFSRVPTPISYDSSAKSARQKRLENLIVVRTTILINLTS